MKKTKQTTIFCECVCWCTWGLLSNFIVHHTVTRKKLINKFQKNIEFYNDFLQEKKYLAGV